VAVLVSQVAGVEEARSIAERLTEAVRTPVTVAGEEVSLTPSIGGVLGRGGDRTEDLLERADRAMYAAKRHPDINYELAAGP